MLDNYLIIHKSILPEYYEKVVAARRLLEEGRVREVSQAVKDVGISRSTYYKYKDFILEPSEMAGGRKAVLSVMLSHEPGVLSAVLGHISQQGASVLTITQSLPIRGKASVTVTLDISGMSGPLTGLMSDLSQTPGAENPRLVAVEEGKTKSVGTCSNAFLSPKKGHGSAANEYAVSVVETEDVYTLAALIFPAGLLKVFEAFAEPAVMGQHLNFRQAKPSEVGASHEVHLRAIAADQLQRRHEDKAAALQPMSILSAAISRSTVSAPLFRTASSR